MKSLRHGTSRGFLVSYHGDNRATFQCGKGHQFKASVIKKIPPTGLGSLQNGIKQLVSWWSKEKGGVTVICPKCKAEGRP